MVGFAATADAASHSWGATAGMKPGNPALYADARTHECHLKTPGAHGRADMPCPPQPAGTAGAAAMANSHNPSLRKHI